MWSTCEVFYDGGLVDRGCSTNTGVAGHLFQEAMHSAHGEKYPSPSRPGLGLLPFLPSPSRHFSVSDSSPGENAEVSSLDAWF